MRKTSTLFLIFTCLLFAPTLHGQGAEKVLVKSFNLEGNYAVKLDLPGIVEVKEWDNAYMRIEMHIAVDNVNESLLRTLIQTGRYNIYGKTEEGVYKVFIPGLSKQVKVGGKEIDETFSFTILCPSEVGIVEEPEPETAPAPDPNILTSSL
ncbi:MAG: hypothetical protein H6563_08300 [Lewinellaceae bacterium]|nr:hypothetical protein [Lewinellaceae bacterium]